MQLLTLDKSQTTKLFWVVAGVLVAVMLYTAKQDDPGVVAAALLLAIVASYPLNFWLLGLSRGLPIWPVFALVNGTFAALPMVQDPETLDAYSSGEIIMGGVTLIGFIAIGTAVWLGVTNRKAKAPESVLMVSREHADRYLFAFIAAGLFFQLNFLFWWVSFPGNTMQIMRGITMALNTLGIFVLSFYAGRNMLSRPKEVLLLIMGSGTALAAAATLIMANAIVPVAMMLLGYALGSGKVPWKGMIAVFVLAALLHPGKFAMRNLYWGGERPPLTLLGMPQYFGDWLGYGLEEVGLVQSDNRDPTKPEASSLFERAGNIHMLLLVQRKSPNEVPFLNGITYEPIPRLLIPRIIDDDKGISHAGNILLTVNYGVQSIEQTQTTSIYWGLVPEAYANYGYFGVAGLAVVLGLFYGFITNLTVGVPMTSLRFVLGLLIMAAATKADTMGVFVTSQFQGIVGVSMAALVLMKRQRNPFAASAANGGLLAYGTTGRWDEASVGRGLRDDRTNGLRDQGTKGLKDEETAEAKRRQVADATNGLKDGASVGRGLLDSRSGAETGHVGTNRYRTNGLRDGASVGRGLKDQETKRQPEVGGLRPETGDRLQGNQLIKDEEKAVRFAADGSTARMMPGKAPGRVAPWMPNWMKRQIAAEQRAAAEQGAERKG